MPDGHPAERILHSADEAASAVLEQAQQAAAQGTFAVGGCIVENATGRILHAEHNNVLKPLPGAAAPFTYDPTAHGERQLVHWYYAHKEQLGLSEPEALTIVTSLDPCAMCTGALLTAGFNVGVLAIDDFAGMNHDGAFTFPSLPPALRAEAKARFGYYACGDASRDPPRYVRDYVGGADVAFRSTRADAQRLLECEEVFGTSVDAVRTSSSEAGLPPEALRDPASLPDASPIKTRFRRLYPGAFRDKTPDARRPGEDLCRLLESVVDSAPGAANAVALLDPFGNVVLCLPDKPGTSPVHTAFMNVTREYATTRFALMGDAATRDEAEARLTHPKYGTFVSLHAPDPEDARSIMTLGAYGSTMEGPVPQVSPANFQYYHPPGKGTIQALDSTIANLPPFYTKMAQLSVMQVALDPG